MTLSELLVGIGIVGGAAGWVIRGVTGEIDRAAVVVAQGALVDAYREARSAAVALGRPAEVVVAAESLVVRSVGVVDTVVLRRVPGPMAAGVRLTPAAHLSAFGAGGLGAGPANVTLRLERGGVVREIVVSRLGRLRVR